MSDGRGSRALRRRKRQCRNQRVGSTGNYNRSGMGACDGLRGGSGRSSNVRIRGDVQVGGTERLPIGNNILQDQTHFAAR